MGEMSIDELREQIKAAEARAEECRRRVGDVMDSTKLTPSGKIPQAAVEAMKRAQFEAEAAIRKLNTLSAALRTVTRAQSAPAPKATRAARKK